MFFPAVTAARVKTIALVGNPNSGKTTIFNALTGLRQKVSNYPGVTVEKKEGRLVLGEGMEATVIDLPGTYSLYATSPDEKITTDIILGQSPRTANPDLVVCVLDANSLERNLYLVSQIIDRNLPLVVALNMVDAAEHEGIHINAGRLATALGVPVVPTVGNKGIGIAELKEAIAVTSTPSPKARAWTLPRAVQEECDELVSLLRQHHQFDAPLAFHHALALLTAPEALAEHHDRYAPELLAHVRKDHARLDFLGVDRGSVFVEARYAWIGEICARCVTHDGRKKKRLSDRIDRVLTHKIWGFVIFAGLMALMFQMMFTWANVPMGLIASGFGWLVQHIEAVIPRGDLRDLIVNGAIGGVSAVVTFLPQIIFLFLFIALFEDTGYMARAAFIMDRLMSKAGLHGKSFIPLLGSFACAVPGIMSARTIESHRDRLVTMLVAPLMSCSARLPVYTLLIAAFIPQENILGIFSLAGIVLFALYFFGLLTALMLAWVFRKTLLRGGPPVFIMELPPYTMPSWKSIVHQLWERSWEFLKRAGTIILGASVILWFLATYPKLDHANPAQQLEHSFVGRAGHLIEPVIRPLGFNWKIGVGLVGSLLQREVFVSTMGTMYNIQHADEAAGTLAEQMRRDIDPMTGRPTFTTLTAVCLMVYFLLAMQCMSTVAVMRRETNGWTWPLFQVAYMTALAYGLTFMLYRVGVALGA